MKINPDIFRKYDIRAVIPDDLDLEGVKRIIWAINFLYKPKKVVLGFDARLTGKKIHDTVTNTFAASGVEVTSLGMITTDMIYFAAGKYDYDLGIMITASHNPSEYNGFKIVKRGAVALSGETGIYDIRDLAISKKKLEVVGDKGKISNKNLFDEWVAYCLDLIAVDKIKPLKVVIDAGNGVGGILIERVKNFLPIKIVALYFEPDGHFPHHLPNPLKEENIQDLIQKVKAEKADLGLAFDGDADRVSFIDENGKFITGTILTSIISEYLLKRSPGATILYNAVCGRIAPETIKKLGGKPIRVQVGHTLIKQAMRKYDALFAGEHSGHYFYKKTFYAESALVTILIILALVSQENQPLSAIVKRFSKYVSDPETSWEVDDKQKTMELLEKEYKNKKGFRIDWFDGLTVQTKDWWFIIRPSGTEPVLRFNIEADNKTLLKKNRVILFKKLKNLGAKRLTNEYPK